MDKLQQTGLNLGRFFNLKRGRLRAAHLWCYLVKLTKLKLKILPKQLLGSVPLDIMLRGLAYFFWGTKRRRKQGFTTLIPARDKLGQKLRRRRARQLRLTPTPVS